MTPLLLLLGVVLIVSGAVMALVFAHLAYQIVYTPQNIPVLTYILGHIPANIEPSSFKGTINNQTFEVFIPESLTIYSFTFLMFVGFGLLLGISRCLSGIGIQIVRVLWKNLTEPQ